MFFLCRQLAKAYPHLLVSVLVIIGFSCAQTKKNSKLPDGIQLCKKDDPKLDECLTNLFESLRPRFLQGMPEIGLPSLDPLVIPEVVVFKGGKGQMRAVGHNVKVNGISDLKLNYIRANPDKLEISVGVFFPFLKFEGTYDVNMKFLNLPLKGKGPMKGNATAVTSEAVLKGKFFEKDGQKYVEFVNATVDVQFKDYGIRVDKLFPDKQLNDAINIIMNDHKSQSIQTAKPIVDKVAGRMLLDMVNEIAKNFSFDEVFA